MTLNIVARFILLEGGSSLLVRLYFFGRKLAFGSTKGLNGAFIFFLPLVEPCRHCKARAQKNLPLCLDKNMRS